MLQFFYKMRKNKKGFTLIELIVVIAILAILALLAIPRLSGFTENARQATDEEAAAVIANAAAMYVASNNIADGTYNTTELDETGARLIDSSDCTMTSQAYSGTISQFTVTGGVVRVVTPFHGNFGPTVAYEITK